MIVDPDFLDHWRTRMLVDLLGGDELAPHYLLRLWGHCQSRKSTAFEMPTAGLKALCRAACDGATLERALIDCGYLARNGGDVEVLKWAEQNASLIAAWENGGRGGRPPKQKPDQNPRVMDVEPMENQSETQAKPIGVDRIREEEKRKGESKAKAATPPALPGWLPAESWAGYLEMRKKQKKPPTDRAIVLVLNALDAMRVSGQDVAAVLDKSTKNNWIDVYPIRDDVPKGSSGGAWWASEASILAKAAEVGVVANPGESTPTVKAKVEAAIANGGKPPPPPRSRADVQIAPVQGKSAMPAGLNLKALLTRAEP